MSVTIIGLGNVLLGDDGFGPFVVEVLRRSYILPAEVELLDLGTPGLGLISYLCGSEAVVIVDTVAGVGIPGNVRVYEGADLERLPSHPRVSPHDPAVPFQSLALPAKVRAMCASWVPCPVRLNWAQG